MLVELSPEPVLCDECKGVHPKHSLSAPEKGFYQEVTFQSQGISWDNATSSHLMEGEEDNRLHVEISCLARLRSTKGELNTGLEGPQRFSAVVKINPARA